MSKFSYPGFFPCETEWTSRSLTDLVSHLNERYRRPTERRIEAIRGLLSQIGPSGHQRCEGYHRLAKIFCSLCETIEEHVWLKDHILGPAVVNVERGLRLDPGARDALCEMIMTLGDEHSRLRSIAASLWRAATDVAGSPVPVDEAVLASDLDLLALLLDEQLNLEDRCLWPRALILLQRPV
jgi:iron-sulfur cluster repair protein YtfE (RIC family)